MRVFFIVAVAVFFTFHHQLKAQNKVRWMSFEDALKKSESKPKKIFVDVYTEWCKWCKHLENTTLSEDKIAKYINENYYPVKFDAQYKNPIEYNNVEYSYVKAYPQGYHELAAELLSGKLSFPSIVIIDENLKVIQALDGYKNCIEMDMIIQYFATNNYKTIPWRRYSKNFHNVPVGN
ncbi:MAG TPA: DUF255 domain-containing protein [Saprospiraceae bacterium]|nr:DUF255 domain-containing protein [Saprospiraceae bacterium]HOY13472.1 DUF255 domain-containing protein [Saprospiraceae bacterium]HPN70136.1 DUF255 domain-containing protein [Saprospiraceae bacterium]